MAFTPNLSDHTPTHLRKYRYRPGSKKYLLWSMIEATDKLNELKRERKISKNPLVSNPIGKIREKKGFISRLFRLF